jgi:hypothetical protein
LGFVVARTSHYPAGMNALDRSWSDDSSEVTRPGDVLALSGEPHANDDQVWPVEAFLEDGWEDESPALSFFLIGGPPSVVRMHYWAGVVTQAHGVVKRVDEDLVVLGTPGSPFHEISLGYRLPASLDLRPLIGRRVRLTLEEAPPSGGVSAQTLTIRTADDHVWLVARFGGVRGVEHCIAGVEVHMSLSMRDDGPLVITPPDLRHSVARGEEAMILIGSCRYIAELVWRDDSGSAAYFIADDRLWH